MSKVKQQQQPAATPAAPAQTAAAAGAAAGTVAGEAMGDQGGDDQESEEERLEREADEAAVAAAAAAPPVKPAKPAKAADPLADLVGEANGRKDATAISLLLEACEKYQVNPSKLAKPAELVAWRFIEGGDEVPDAVTFVTAGGVKVMHHDDPAWPMDLDTLDRLRRVFGLFRADPKTKELVILPIPEDLALPKVAVTGISTAPAEHRYEGGYLRSGGKNAAALKEERRKARAARMGLA